MNELTNEQLLSMYRHEYYLACKKIEHLEQESKYLEEFRKDLMSKYLKLESEYNTLEDEIDKIREDLNEQYGLG